MHVCYVDHANIHTTYKIFIYTNKKQNIFFKYKKHVTHKTGICDTNIRTIYTLKTNKEM